MGGYVLISNWWQAAGKRQKQGGSCSSNMDG